MGDNGKSSISDHQKHPHLDTNMVDPPPIVNDMSLKMSGICLGLSGMGWSGVGRSRVVLGWRGPREAGLREPCPR